MEARVAMVFSRAITAKDRRLPFDIEPATECDRVVGVALEEKSGPRSTGGRAILDDDSGDIVVIEPESDAGGPATAVVGAGEITPGTAAVEEAVSVM